MEWNDWSAVTTRRCWPDQDTLPGPSQPQLPGVDVKQCDDRKFGGGAFALIAPAGTITNPTIVRRNTIRHIGPSAGIQIGKNSIAQLNHMCAPPHVHTPTVFLSRKSSRSRETRADLWGAGMTRRTYSWMDR